MEIKDGVLQVTTLKQNTKNMENQNVSTKIVSLLESKKLKFPTVINRAIDKANNER